MGVDGDWCFVGHGGHEEFCCCGRKRPTSQKHTGSLSSVFYLFVPFRPESASTRFHDHCDLCPSVRFITHRIVYSDDTRDI